MGETADEHTQDRGDGVPKLPGSRGMGSRSLHLEDDKRGEEF